MQLRWFIVDKSAVARWVSLNTSLNNHVAGMGITIPFFSVCIANPISGVYISGQPKEKRDRYCLIKQFCIYRHRSIRDVYRRSHIFLILCSRSCHLLSHPGDACSLHHCTQFFKRTVGHLQVFSPLSRTELVQHHSL